MDGEKRGVGGPLESLPGGFGLRRVLKALFKKRVPERRKHTQWKGN